MAVASGVFRQGNSFWSLTDNTDPATLAAATNAQVGKYLGEQLGVKAAVKYTSNALAMLSNPNAGYGHYSQSLKASLEREAAVYKSDIARIKKLGLPEDRAMEIALENSRSRVSAEMKLLELEFPMAGNDSMLATATVKGGHDIALKNPFKYSSNSIDQAKYEKYKTAYKSKKARKAKKAEK